MNTDLKPCPFCGHADDLMHETVRGWEGVVCCDYCGASGPYPHGLAYDGDGAWNTRTTSETSNAR